MTKRAIIIHGWQGNPKQGWYPWLGSELEKRGFKVSIPVMPNTEDPKPEEWISALSNVIGELDNDVYMIGHSAGANTIMRYLEKKHTQKAGGAVLVAPWPSLKPEDRRYGKEMGARWMAKPYDWDVISNNARKITAIFSTNDPYVSINDADVFKEKLHCSVIIEEGKKHMYTAPWFTELPSALEAVLE
jgi:hypothetical protein